MALAAISNTLSYAEPFLWAIAFAVFLRAKNRSRFPAFGVFLGIRAISTFLLIGILHAHLIAPSIDGHLLYTYYFGTYWTSYLLGCVVLFFSLQELFRHAMAPLPGLSRLGILGFRWAALASLVIAGTTIFTSLPAVSHDARCNFVFAQIADCLCILELCLLAFLAMSIHALGLTFRSRVFGISLGFGMMAAMDFVVNALHSDIYAWPNQVIEIVTAVSLVVWTAYLLLPEPVRQRAMLPITSPLLRWNDLAMALGHNTQQTAGQGGFLQNVEGVVDRVLAKNSMNNAG